jgi:CelD/BcsL family acetyltransferase involved in cellulose biosynthesis
LNNRSISCFQGLDKLMQTRAPEAMELRSSDSFVTNVASHDSTVQTLKSVTVHDFDALSPHIPAWDRLAWEAPQNIWTLLPGWAEAVLRHQLKPNEKWFCSFVYFGDRLVAALPVIVTPHAFLGHLFPHLRPVSDDIALAPDCAAMAFKALLYEVGRQVPQHIAFNLKAARQNSPLWDVLSEGTGGYVVYRGHCHRLWFLDVARDAESYWSSLCKMRQNLRRSRRRLEKRGAVSVEIRTGAEAGEDFLDEFLALEASGWKGRMGTAIRNNPDKLAFYTTVVRNFAQQNRLEWHSVRVDGRLVAAQIGIRCREALILPRYAYDEEFSECSPGHVLTEEVIKDAFSRREIAELNPMSTADQCRLWHMACDTYSDVHLVRLSAVPLLFHLPYVAARTAYHDYVRSRVPVSVKRAVRQFKLGEYRKLLRPVFERIAHKWMPSLPP